MSVRRCQREVSSLEFIEWLALDSLDGPGGYLRGDIQASWIANAIANANSTKPVRFERTWLKFEEPISHDEKMRLSMERWRAFKASHNARIARKEDRRKQRAATHSRLKE